MKPRFKILLLLLTAILLSTLVTLCASFHVSLQASDKADYEQNEIRSIIETDSRVTVVFSDQGQNYGRYIHYLTVQLSEMEENPLRLKATVWIHEKESGAAQQINLELTDVNPVYVTREILNIDRKNVVSVDLERTDGQPLLIEDIQIDNAFHFNWYLFLTAFVILTLLLLFADALVLWFRSRKPIDGKKMCVRAFPVLCMSAGLLFCICLPLNKVGADEETHLQAVLQLASFPSGQLHVSDVLMRQLIVTEYNNPEAQPGGLLEQKEFTEYLAVNSDYKNGSRTPDFYVPANRIPAYAPMAIVCKIGKGLSLPWTTILRLIRVANLTIYMLLVWAALKLTPCGHTLMLLIGLLPESVFLASTVSYDAFINGCMLLAMAFLLRLLTQEEKTRKALLMDFCGFCIPLMLGCLVKAVYAPMFLAALLVPAGKKSSGKKTVVITIAVLAAFLLLVLVFIVPALVDPSTSGDVRGGEVSIRNQLIFIFSDPLRYAGILLSQMIRWIPQCFLGPDCTTFMGHIVSGSTAYKGAWIPILIMLAALTVSGVYDLSCHKEKAFISVGQRLWLLAACFACSALIWTAMYLAFTVPGATEIAGVQGRYFIPLLFPVYFAFGAGSGLETGKSLQPAAEGQAKPALLVRDRGMWYHLLILGLGMALLLQFVKAVFLPCCL